MSATASFTSQAIAEWVKIFPRQVTETYTSSVTFMKQLTVVAVSTITYLKNLFPEESYTVENFGGIRIRILKKKCRNELAQFLSTALTQAFEAFDKKYLHQLVICFYDGECKMENLVEYHIFEFSYNSDGVTMDVRSKGRDATKHSSRYTFDNIKERTLQLIRACVVVMQACQTEMPDTYDVSLRLYYNEDAPEGYQAPGFLTGDENEDHLESTIAETVKLGWVETRFHKLTARTYIKENFGSSYEAIPSENPPAMSQVELDFDGSSVQKSVSDSSEIRVLCPCGKFDNNDELHALLTCQYCNTQQHAACFGLTREAAARFIQHCCAECTDIDPSRKATDQRLASLSAKKRECLCIFRRTLEWCSHTTSLGVQELSDKFSMSPLNAAKLMKLLDSHGVISHGSETDIISPRQIIPDQLKEVMSKFFQNEEHDIVDRLIAETLSQSSQPDPVGDVLSPMEKVSLQNDITISRVIDPEPIRDVQDENLKEYRDAIMVNVEEETGLPLSGSHNPVDVENIGKKGGKRKLDRPRRTGVRTKRTKTQLY